MCPSYRVTGEERDVTRGRANTLRLAITGQLGPDAFTSAEMAETLKLCVSCKACRRECPTGVDMARMKIEFLSARTEKFGLSLHDRLIGYLPRYAPYAARLHWLFNLRDTVPGAARLSEAIAGFSARRSLPKWRSDVFEESELSRLGLLQAHQNRGLRMRAPSPQRGEGWGEGTPTARPAPLTPPYPQRGEGEDRVNCEVVLFADTFNRYFERENIDAALAVLAARQRPLNRR